MYAHVDLLAAHPQDFLADQVGHGEDRASNKAVLDHDLAPTATNDVGAELPVMPARRKLTELKRA